MILADSQIRDLCSLPTFVLTHRKQVFLTTMTGDQIDAFNREQGIPEDQEGSLGNLIIKRRELTDEERSNWKPMISPYIPGQVKKYRRDPNKEELAIWEKAKSGGPIPDNFVCENLESGFVVDEKVISFGTSSYGYDVRIANEFKLFTNINNSIVDPKNFTDKAYVNFVGDVCIIPPHSFVLARSVERFVIPRNVTAIVLNKSTYARCGINCLASPLESEWEGYITLEYHNGSGLPAKLYANEGAAQVLFLTGETCAVSYADRGGKYQNQPSEVIVSKV